VAVSVAVIASAATAHPAARGPQITVQPTFFLVWSR